MLNMMVFIFVLLHFLPRLSWGGLDGAAVDSSARSVGFEAVAAGTDGSHCALPRLALILMMLFLELKSSVPRWNGVSALKSHAV